MRITDLSVDGFGVWSQLELAELSDQLSVFYGPNEAGKTTLMQFVRSVLYGFSPQRRARYLPPLSGGRPGGTLRVVDGQTAYAVSRHADAAGETGEAAIVHADRDVAADEGTLARLLGEVDEPVFNHVFAFGLREIQELGTLSDTQAADELYNLALGSDRVSLIEVLNELETSRNRLLASDDRPSLVTQLVGQRERLRDEIDDLSQATIRYLTLSAEHRSLDGEISRLETEHAHFEEQSRELALARALSGRWQRRVAIDAELAGLGACDGLPNNALARFERLGTRLSVRRRRFERLRQQRDLVRADMARLAVNESLCRQAPRFEALAEQQHWLRALEGQVAQLEETVFELEARREETHKQWGTTAGEGAATLSKRNVAELRAAARALGEARREAADLRARAATAQETAAGFSREIDAALGEAASRGLTETLAVAGELVSLLRRRVQLDERLDQMSRREAQLEDESHEHLENQVLPAWALAGLGSLFVLGCALVLLYVAGLVLPASLRGALGWPVGLIGVLAAAAAGAIKFAMEHRAAAQLDACHGQFHLLKDQMKEARAERDELDRQLPRGGGPLVARLQNAEKALARCEELLPLESQREAAQRDAAALLAQAQTARERQQKLRKNWRRLLDQYGLPRDMRPRALVAYWRGREQGRGLSQSIDEKQRELAARRAEYDTLGTRIRQLAAEAGIVPRGERPLDLLVQCLGELTQQQKLIQRRDELARQSDRLRRRQRKLRREAAQLRRRRLLLLRAAGATDEAEFRRRAAAQAQALQLRTERTMLAQEIAGSLGGGFTEERLAEWLSTQKNLEQLDVEFAAARQNAFERLSRCVQRRGEMNEQLRMLVDNRQLAHMRIELGIVEKRMADALDRWRVLAVCGILLSAVREYYEREHQPHALREASVYLQRLTGGRYRRVWTPLGEHSLRVDDEQGRALSVEVLSRGTREQLFLALRLALVSSYARRGVTLPLVLDDVLVNFDMGRAKAAAAVLRDFARQGHQVLVFTCHEHIARLFRNLKTDVRQLPDHLPPPGVGEAMPGRRSRRVRPELPPEPAVEPEPVVPTADESEAAETPRQIAQDVQVAEEPVAPPPSQAATAEPPGQPRPVRRVPQRAGGRIQRAQWSAEEFEGELTDRVRPVERDETWDREVHSDFEDGFAAGDDAEAA